MPSTWVGEQLRERDLAHGERKPTDTSKAIKHDRWSFLREASASKSETPSGRSTTTSPSRTQRKCGSFSPLATAGSDRPNHGYRG
jgi:hypothetical protein